MSNDCVVDASVGIKLFVDEALSDQAHALFARLTEATPARLHVPDLFYVECSNVLWKYVRRMGMDAGDAGSFVDILGQLALVVTPSAMLIRDALTIALEHEITVYDASYVALATSLALPLWTADRRLVRAISGAPFDVRFLGAEDLLPAG